MHIRVDEDVGLQVAIFGVRSKLHWVVSGLRVDMREKEGKGRNWYAVENVDARLPRGCVVIRYGAEEQIAYRDEETCESVQDVDDILPTRSYQASAHE